jgi:hypothetical protein
MSTEHLPKTLMAGDDWQIDAALRDHDGNPTNLINVDLAWFLLDQANNRVINRNGVSIEVTDWEGGKCSITVAGAITATLTPGTYSDVLRLTLHSGPGTPDLLRTTAWKGTIKVTASPFESTLDGAEQAAGTEQ